MESAEKRWYRPRELADQLGVPGSTLRTYAARFATLLSATARQGAGGDGRGFRHRRYSEEDLATLRTAKDLLDAGMSYDAVLYRLTGDVATRPSPPRRHRPARSRSPRASNVSSSRESDPPPAESVATLAPSPPIVVATIDDLRAEIRGALAEIVPAAFPEASARPAVESRDFDRLARQLHQIQDRLDRLEAFLYGLTQPATHPGWFSRLLHKG